MFELLFIYLDPNADLYAVGARAVDSLPKCIAIIHEQSSKPHSFKSLYACRMMQPGDRLTPYHHLTDDNMVDWQEWWYSNTVSPQPKR